MTDLQYGWFWGIIAGDLYYRVIAQWAGFVYHDHSPWVGLLEVVVLCAPLAYVTARFLIPKTRGAS